jgi:nucleoid DNA-binding protein
MNAGDYVKNVAKRMDLSQAETKRLIDLTLETVVSALDDGETFTLPGLGTFGTKIREQHRAYSPFHKRFMILPKKRIITYYPSSKIKDEFKDTRVEK